MDRHHTPPTVECADVRQPWLLWLLLPCVLCALAAGCAPPLVQYQLNEGVVDTLGEPQATQRLQEALERCINPQVMNIEVTDDFLSYRYRGTAVENRIHFLNIGKIEVYENNVVFVRATNAILLAQFIFGNPQDPKMFGDVLASFRARRVRRG